jgi:hypothetical protein
MDRERNKLSISRKSSGLHVKSKLTLQQLLFKVTKENLHHQVDYGPAVGEEI